MRQKFQQNLRYNLKIRKNKGTFDIIPDIRENVTLVQLMDTLGNVNHYISILCYWIFDSNFEKSLCLTRESLDIICYPSVGEEQVAKYETVFYAVRTMWAPGNPKIG